MRNSTTWSLFHTLKCNSRNFCFFSSPLSLSSSLRRKSFTSTSATIISTTWTHCINQESSSFQMSASNAKLHGRQTGRATAGSSLNSNRHRRCQMAKVKIAKVNCKYSKIWKCSANNGNIIQVQTLSLSLSRRRAKWKTVFARSSISKVLIYVTGSGRILISRFCCHSTSAVLSMKQKPMNKRRVPIIRSIPKGLMQWGQSSASDVQRHSRPTVPFIYKDKVITSILR